MAYPATALPSRSPVAAFGGDAELQATLIALQEAGIRCSGPELHKAARQAGVEVGRDQTRLLVRLAGIRGAGERTVTSRTAAEDGLTIIRI